MALRFLKSSNAIRGTLIFWFVLQSANLRGADAELEYDSHGNDCKAERDAVNDRIATFKQSEKYSAECKEALAHVAKPCTNPDWQTDESGQQTLVSKDASLPATWDNYVNRGVDSANTLRRQSAMCDKTVKRAVSGENGKCAQGTDEDKRASGILKPLVDRLVACVKSSGDHAEDFARKMLAERKGTSSDGQSLDINCQTLNSREDEGLKVCSYSNGPTHYKEVDPTSEEGKDTSQNNPAKVIMAGGGSCSGNVLGDGETLTTDAHCMQGSGPNQKIETNVRDLDGNWKTVSATCNSNGQPNFGSDQDIAVCKLDQKVSAAPLYMATSDSGISEGCVPEGWMLRCSKPAILATDGQAVRTETFPVTSNGMVVSEGVVRTWASTDAGGYGTNTNTYSQPATSGGGQVTQVDGYRAIIAPNSFHNSWWGSTDSRFDNAFGNQSMGMDFNTVRDLQIGLVPESLIQDGEPTIRALAGTP